jgi:hypothetical protein
LLDRITFCGELPQFQKPASNSAYRAGNNYVTFSWNDWPDWWRFAEKILLAILGSSCAISPALNRRASAAVRLNVKK